MKIEDRLLKLKKTFAKDKDIYFVFIFGSAVGRKQKKNSDIDIAIFFKKSPEGLDLLYLVNNLSELAGKEVDIAVLNKASAILRHQVVKYGYSLINKDPLTYRKFREKTITDYQEYKFISGMDIYDR